MTKMRAIAESVSATARKVAELGNSSDQIKLAERTTTATKEIAEMIRTVQDETKSAVSAMEAGTVQVEEGVKTTARLGRRCRGSFKCLTMWAR